MPLPLLGAYPGHAPRRRASIVLLSALNLVVPAALAAAGGDEAPSGDASRAPANETAAPAAEGSFSREVQARVPEANACYRAALVTQPTLAGRLVLHFTITPKGTVSNAVIRDSTLQSPKVETCIREAVLKWTFTQPENAQDTHVAVPIDLGPELAASNVRLPPGIIARHVLDQSAVAYSAEKRVVVFNQCWSVKDGPPSPGHAKPGDAGAPAASAAAGPLGGEGCVVVVSPLAGGTTKEIPVFQPGEAPNARARKKKETSAWTKLLPHLKGGTFVELLPTEWPAQSPDLVLPQLDLVLVFSNDSIRVTRRASKPGAKPVVVGEVKTSVPRGAAQPVAVYAAPDQRVLVVALREGPVPAGQAKPDAKSEVKSASASHFEVIDVFR